ncbi:MAG: hypothetical protein QOD89_3139 [Bradyrhizobium sp.]|nr:hypothetical protein [Bradyrhizobium sp.]
MYTYPRPQNLAYPDRVLFGEGALSRSDPSVDRARAGRTGAPRNGRQADGRVERREAQRLPWARAVALPREVGTLIPPPRVPAGALAPPAAPSPRLGSRGTGKPRTHRAARTRNHVRHSGALAPLRKRTRNPEIRLGASTPLDSGFAPKRRAPERRMGGCLKFESEI